jgi:hypothetical protein
MLHTSSRLFFLVAVAIWYSAATARTNPDCLNHLGGGFSDAECYAGLSNDLVLDNKKLYVKLRSTIPADNVHVKLLDDYMKAQDESIKYCNLQRNAGGKWKTDHDGSMFPAIYAQCAYEFRKAQNAFLKNALEMANWK